MDFLALLMRAFCTLSWLESIMKFRVWRFCDVALPEFVNLVIPSSNTLSGRQQKGLVLNLSHSLKKNGVLIIYLQTLNKDLNGLFKPAI